MSDTENGVEGVGLGLGQAGPRAAYQVETPKSFDFQSPEDWPRWLRRFERFRKTSGLHSQSQEDQVNALIYTMGDEAEDILARVGLTEAEQSTYAAVIDQFEKHFVARRNVIYERARFNKRRQQVGENIETFVTDLHCLAKHCQYGQLAEELIRDRVVIGILDNKLSEILQLDPELTLEKAVAKVRASENIKKQQGVVRQDASTDPDKNDKVDAVNNYKHKNTGRPGQNRSSKGTGHSNTSRLNSNRNCHRCGKEFHPVEKCPARNAICRKCNKKGHWAAECRRKNIAEVEGDSDNGVEFLGEVTGGPKTSCVNSNINTVCSQKAWYAIVKINALQVKFKIDTGADVSVVPQSIIERVTPSINLEHTDKQLFGPGKTPLPIVGKVRATMAWENQMAVQEIFIMDTRQQEPLLGRPAIQALEMLSWINGISSADMSQTCRPELFEGLGKFDGEYHIAMKKDAKPYSVSVPRRIPIPLRKQVKEELDRMVKAGVISPIEEPTPWCAGMVVVPKKAGSIRICVDLSQLNKGVLREKYQLPTVEESLSQLEGAVIFSKLDANTGFWQIPLSKESAQLTTFITPFGRFFFNRLPFGISSAPEHFSRKMMQVLEGCEGVICQMDDILVYGSGQEEHDTRLSIVLSKLHKAGFTLNKKKCEFSVKRIKFLGHEISNEGIRADEDKLKAIKDLNNPADITELRRFFGMVNQVAKFVPGLAELSQPLRELLKKDNEFLWTSIHTTAFNKIKSMLTETPVLALYDTNRQVRICADASSYGLGAVLEQESGEGQWKPVAYASRAMSETEGRYAQIEKEALSITWACEKFSQLISGRDFIIHTDHKPLVPIFGSKPISELSARLQRFKMRLMRFSFKIEHVPGKNFYTADTLSRAQHSEPCSEEDILLQDDVEVFVQQVVKGTPATDRRIEEIQEAQRKDEVISRLKAYTLHGWPTRKKVEQSCLPYWNVHSDLAVHGEILFMGTRIVIPREMHREILSRLHEGHMGVTKTQRQARETVYWPNINEDVRAMVQRCQKCIELRKNIPEPLMPTPFPNLPWEKVGIDFADIEGKTYLVVEDYFSRYPEFVKMDRTTSSLVIDRLKSIFAHHGIPKTVRTDGGPPFNSHDFQKFAQTFGFRHEKSSPTFAQSNGLAESAVKVIKRMVKKSEDPYLAVLCYRNTPLECGYSPSQLCMGRNLRSTLPTSSQYLQPKWPNLEEVAKRENQIKERQKKYFDERHRAKELPKTGVGERVWVQDKRLYGEVIGLGPEPRSLQIKTPAGTLRRNRASVIPAPIQEPILQLPTERDPLRVLPPVSPPRMSTPGPSSKQVQETLPGTSASQSEVPSTRSGRRIRPPKRLDL